MSSQPRVLAESPRYLLVNEYEAAFVIHRRTGERLPLGDHYGDPVCGLIAPAEDWFLVGGEGLTFLDLKRGAREFLRREQGGLESGVFFVHAMRLETPATVRILVDPWSDGASTWLLDTNTLVIAKLADGPRLVGQPFTEDVPF